MRHKILRKQDDQVGKLLTSYIRGNKATFATSAKKMLSAYPKYDS